MQMQNGFGRIEQALGDFEMRLVRVESGLEAIEHGIAGLDRSFDRVRDEYFADHRRRIELLEGRAFGTEK